MEEAEIKNLYPFSSGNRLDEINTYFYTTYSGRSFLSAWRDSRKPFIKTNDCVVNIKDLFSKDTDISNENYFDIINTNDSQVDTNILFNVLYEELQSENIDFQYGEIATWLNLLVKKFEVSKRVFSNYAGEKLLIVDRKNYRRVSLYYKFAYLMVYAYEKSEKLQYLNVLLKVIDTLCAIYAKEEADSKVKYEHFLSDLIHKEEKYINKLQQKLTNDSI